MPARAKPQMHMDDRIIDDHALELLLEERERLKQGAADFRTADKATKDKLRGIETPVPFRVGRFVIDRKKTPAKSVAFETEEGYRLSIDTVDGSPAEGPPEGDPAALRHEIDGHIAAVQEAGAVVEPGTEAEAAADAEAWSKVRRDEE